MSWSGAPVWAIALVVAVLAGPLVGAAGYRLGARRAGREMPADWRARWKDRALFAAALAAGSAVYAAVVVGSFNGLTAFARHHLGWGGPDGQGWRQYIVPVTLDGVAAAFAFLAGRSVLRRRSPVRCYLMVWGATGASAAANFAEGEGSHGAAAGAYLAFLSVAGIAIFHTFLDQLAHSGPAYVRRRYPPFGLRWVTAFGSTWCAALAWINYPPDDVEPTVPAALAHLDEVREATRQRRRQRRARREADRREAITARAERAALTERARAGHNDPDGPVDQLDRDAVVAGGDRSTSERAPGQTKGPAGTAVKANAPVGEGRIAVGPRAFRRVDAPNDSPPVRPTGRPRMPVRPRASGSGSPAPRLETAADMGEGSKWGRGRLEQLLAERVPAARVPRVDAGERLPAEFADLVGELAAVAGLTRKAGLKVARAWVEAHAPRRLRPVPPSGR